MMHAAVLTALMDNYDTLKPTLPQDGADVQWVCLTDSKELAAEAEERAVFRPGSNFVHSAMIHPTGWEIVYYDRPADEHPNRAAKRPKVHPAMFTDAPASVWLDASFRVVSSRFVVDTVTIARESPAGIAQFGHPWRECTFLEAEESMRLAKYADEVPAIKRQVYAYRKAGMPSGWGLWATGVIAREHRPAVLQWGYRWLAEIRDHSYQDQISHPFVCWTMGARPESLGGTHFANDWLQYEGSGRH